MACRWCAWLATAHAHIRTNSARLGRLFDPRANYCPTCGDYYRAFPLIMQKCAWQKSLYISVFLYSCRSTDTNKSPWKHYRQLGRKRVGSACSVPVASHSIRAKYRNISSSFQGRLAILQCNQVLLSIETLYFAG